MRSVSASACDRLIHPQVTDEAERARQIRLVGALLAGPFLAAAALFVVLPAGAGLALTLAIVCGAFGLAWTGVLIVASTGRTTGVVPAALLAAAVMVAVLVAAAGGAGSPTSALALALPVEAWLILRTRRAALWGAIAALGALGAQTLLPGTVFSGAGIAAWHWALPLAYAATVIPRLDGLLALPVASDKDSATPALESIADGVIILFAANGDVIEANDAAREHFGLEPDLLGGSGLFDRLHISDRVGYLCAMADLRDGARRRSVELRIRLPQHGEGAHADRYGDFAMDMARLDEGSDIVTGLLRDNSEMATLRRKLAKAGEANDCLDIAKGRFLAAVSHELRTPLNSIIGFSDMLLHEMFGGFRDPRQKEYVALVRDSGHHLLDVVNAILDVSKMEAGSYATNPEPFRFREAVDMCSAMMSVQAQAKHIRLITQIAPEVGEVCADRRAVQQMLINLVSNALKFTPQGGTVTIGVKRLGGRVHLWVSDTGIGIAESDLEHLGRPFTQVQNEYNRQYEGTGLGLSLVKGLVALHEGTMSIDSALGDGTTVTITLPIDGPDLTRTHDGAELLTMRSARTKENVDGTLRKAG